MRGQKNHGPEGCLRRHNSHEEMQLLLTRRNEMRTLRFHNPQKLLHLMFSLVLIISMIGISPSNRAMAMPGSPTDETKVPHYFGPYPNWANSPFTLADAQVVITGDGTGAEAVAMVG